MRPSEHVETLTSHPDEVRRALDRIRGHVQEAPRHEDANETLQIVLAEVLNNVVEHAYGFEPGHPIRVALTFHEAALACCVEDQGVTMPGGRPPYGDMPTFEDLATEDLPEGGFGWAMIHAMTEGLSYSREAGRNRLSFTIPVGPDSPEG